MSSESSVVSEKQVDANKKKESWIQVLKYTLCAGSAGVIEAASAFIVMWLLARTLIEGEVLAKFNFLGEEMDWHLMVTQMISLSLSVIWNFTLNRKFTFKSDANVGKVLLLAFAFYIPFFPLSTLFVGWFGPVLSLGMSAGIAAAIAKGCAMIANFVLEFVWQKFFVFRKQDDSAAITVTEATEA